MLNLTVTEISMLKQVSYPTLCRRTCTSRFQ